MWYFAGFPWERDLTIISAKRCRAERGQVIAVCDGVVKDLTNLPPQEQQRALQMANATDNDARPISVNEMRANQKQKEYQLALLEDATLIRQTDSAQTTITLEQRYDSYHMIRVNYLNFWIFTPRGWTLNLKETE